MFAKTRSGEGGPAVEQEVGKVSHHPCWVASLDLHYLQCLVKSRSTLDFVDWVDLAFAIEEGAPQPRLRAMSTLAQSASVPCLLLVEGREEQMCSAFQ